MIKQMCNTYLIMYVLILIEFLTSFLLPYVRRRKNITRELEL